MFMKKDVVIGTKIQNRSMIQNIYERRKYKECLN